MQKDLTVIRARGQILPPMWSGSIYYWFYWSMVAVYAPFLNVYLTDLGLSGVQIGLLAAILPFMTLVLAPFVSAWADRHSRRLRLLQGLFVLWAIILLFWRLPTAFAPIFLLMVLEGAIRSPTMPIGDSVVARMLSRRHLDYGRARLWGSLGFALFTVAAGVLWDRVGFGFMFVGAAFMALPVILVTGKLEEGTAVSPQARRPARALLEDRGLLTLFVVAFLAGAALIVTFLFGGIYIIQLGGNQTYVGLLFGLSALAEAPVMQRSAIILRRTGVPGGLLLSIIIITLTLIGHALAWSPAVMVVASVLKGVGYALFVVASIDLVTTRAPAEWASTAQSMLYAAQIGLAPLLASPISGYIIDKWGGAVLFGVVTSWSLLAVFILVYAIRRGWFNQAA